jgi:3-deoxy-7-phosphoheptulonate synthase
VVIGVIGPEDVIREKPLAAIPGVESVTPVLKPYKLVSYEFRGMHSPVAIGGVSVGGPEIVVMSGPCSVEDREQIVSIAQEVKAAGAKILRGGAFNPRTSPYSFQGLGVEGLKLLAEARKVSRRQRPGRSLCFSMHRRSRGRIEHFQIRSTRRRRL